MTLTVAFARSVALGVALGIAVGATVGLIVLGPAAILGGIRRDQVFEALALFCPAGVFAGTVLGCVAPFVRQRRQRKLFLVAAALYPFATAFSLVGLITMQERAISLTTELVSATTLASIAWISAAYVPIVAGPAIVALLVLERFTRPVNGSA